MCAYICMQIPGTRPGYRISEVEPENLYSSNNKFISSLMGFVGTNFEDYKPWRQACLSPRLPCPQLFSQTSDQDLWSGDGY